MLIREFVDPISPAGIAARIRKDCAPFLASITNVSKQFLWRGLYVDPEEVSALSKIPCPKNRPPKDTNDEDHKFIDTWFLKNMGVRYRSNAIFVSGRTGRAAEYGPLFAVYPIGQFKFCWSPKFGDMYEELVQMLHDPDGLDDFIKVSPNTFSEELAKNYKNTDINAAIKSGNEIMIHAPKGFYMLNYYQAPFKTVIKLLANPQQNKGNT